MITPCDNWLQYFSEQEFHRRWELTLRLSECHASSNRLLPLDLRTRLRIVVFLVPIASSRAGVHVQVKLPVAWIGRAIAFRLTLSDLGVLGELHLERCFDHILQAAALPLAAPHLGFAFLLAFFVEA